MQPHSANVDRSGNARTTEAMGATPPQACRGLSQALGSVIAGAPIEFRGAGDSTRIDEEPTVPRPSLIRDGVRGMITEVFVTVSVSLPLSRIRRGSGSTACNALRMPLEAAGHACRRTARKAWEKPAATALIWSCVLREAGAHGSSGSIRPCSNTGTTRLPAKASVVWEKRATIACTCRAVSRGISGQGSQKPPIQRALRRPERRDPDDGSCG
jgi:hypothetical protein